MSAPAVGLPPEPVGPDRTWPPVGSIGPAEAVARAPRDLEGLEATPGALRFTIASELGLNRLHRTAAQRFVHLNTSPEAAAKLLLSTLTAWDESRGDIEHTTSVLAGELVAPTDAKDVVTGPEQAPPVSTAGGGTRPKANAVANEDTPAPTPTPPAELPTVASASPAAEEPNGTLGKKASARGKRQLRPGNMVAGSGPELQSARQTALPLVPQPADAKPVTTAGASVTWPTVRPELASLIPAPTAEEVDRLRTKLQAEGPREKLVAAIIDGERVLLDGHTRLPLYSELGLVPEFVIEPSITDYPSAREWMIRHQFSRRNLSPAAFSYLLGRLYEEQKGPRGGAHDPNRRATGLVLAEKFGVHARTVEQAARFARELDALSGEHGDEVRVAALGPEPTLSKEAVSAIHKLPPQARGQALEKIVSGKAPAKEILPPGRPARRVPTPVTSQHQPASASSAEPATPAAEEPNEQRADDAHDLAFVLEGLRNALKTKLLLVLTGGPIGQAEASSFSATCDEILAGAIERVRQLERAVKPIAAERERAVVTGLKKAKSRSPGLASTRPPARRRKQSPPGITPETGPPATSSRGAAKGQRS